MNELVAHIGSLATGARGSLYQRLERGLRGAIEQGVIKPEGGLSEVQPGSVKLDDGSAAVKEEDVKSEVDGAADGDANAAGVDDDEVCCGCDPCTCMDISRHAATDPALHPSVDAAVGGGVSHEQCLRCLRMCLVYSVSSVSCLHRSPSGGCVCMTRFLGSSRSEAPA